MNDLNKLFAFEEQIVRVLGTKAEPLFPVVDICRALEIANPTQAVESVDADDLSQVQVTDSQGRTQVTNVVNESGFYTLVLRSDKPKARAFRRWVTREVLPSIRQAGVYVAGVEWKHSWDTAKSGSVQLELLRIFGDTFRERLRLEKEAQGQAATISDADIFWAEVIEGCRTGLFGQTPAQKKFHFRVMRVDAPFPPGRPNQGSWVSQRLYFRPHEVLKVLNEARRKKSQFDFFALKPLKAELTLTSAWMPGQHKQRFTSGLDNAWAVDLDYHPQGYRAISDEEHLAWTQQAEASPDPRLGEMHALVNALHAAEEAPKNVVPYTVPVENA